MGARLRDIRIRLGAAYVVVGLCGLAFLVWLQTPPPLVPWMIFAAVSVYLEWNAVEIDDRVMASAGIVVQIAAGVALGTGNAALTMSVIAVLGILSREDVKQRRFFQPAVNFGIVIITSLAAGLVVDLWAYAGPNGQSLARFALVAASAGVTASVFSLLQVTLVVRASYGKESLLPWADMHTLIPLYAAMGASGGLLGGTYRAIGAESFPLIIGMILIAHRMFKARADVREAHSSTIRGFVKALEARDLFARGHTERVAMFCRLVGGDLGFNARRLQRLRWAALVHDVGTLAVPVDLLRDRSTLTAEEDAQVAANLDQVYELLEGVNFLSGPMRIVRLLGVPLRDAPESAEAYEAQILSVAKHFDRLTNRPRRSDALSQAAAFAELRTSVEPAYDPTVVDALERAIARTGVQYGLVNVDPSITRETYARQAMYDR